ncbi:MULTISPECIES: NUDIX hydrolase [unclassified Rathayibacter]|uniref:NUDIX hydrolase n=1 Tax=unclassified Rathayibacter TaxID=2609250 RepID=UPI0006F33A11|nr:MULTISPECIES: NUDIX domain-containing protein [unclassified Rathayibacter]KQQ05405.1 NTP pyrophosphohydrolase [Rathayibacter sp. Leaf294]KQS13269.1 NTP pyrophosphohydrolase [Rathayibacter sp. Leaf185]
MSSLPPLLVSAVAVIRDRRILMVTARGRDVVYLPGGKVDPGESGAEAAAREAEEELGSAPTRLAELFTVREQAHGEPQGREVHMTVFAAELSAEPRPAGEIDSLHWIRSADAHRCPPAGVATLARLRDLDLID